MLILRSIATTPRSGSLATSESLSFLVVDIFFLHFVISQNFHHGASCGASSMTMTDVLHRYVVCRSQQYRETNIEKVHLRPLEFVSVHSRLLAVVVEF